MVRQRDHCPPQQDTHRWGPQLYHLSAQGQAHCSVADGDLVNHYRSRRHMNRWATIHAYHCRAHTLYSWSWFWSAPLLHDVFRNEHMMLLLLVEVQLLLIFTISSVSQVSEQFVLNECIFHENWHQYNGMLSPLCKPIQIPEDDSMWWLTISSTMMFHYLNDIPFKFHLHSSRNFTSS